MGTRRRAEFGTDGAWLNEVTMSQRTVGLCENHPVAEKDSDDGKKMLSFLEPLDSHTT